MGDSDESKALLADIFKLLGNSAYGKTIEDVTRQTNVIYTKDENKVNRAVGISVYQLAKLRMLEFYYDFLDKYVELIQMDTDSLYMGISGESIEEIVRPELKAEFEAEKKLWLSWNKWSSRTPGLFKLEFEGTRMIALSPKTIIGMTEKKKKKRR